MSTRLKNCPIYDGPGDDLMGQRDETGGRIILVPDAPPVQKGPDDVQHIRIMWGQRLIDDLMAGRYRTLICAVNSVDNSQGFIRSIAERLPSSQWREPMITDHARHFAQPGRTTVVKYDLGGVEVLGLLRPAGRDHLMLDDLSAGFRIATAMLRCRADRSPAASVCFLGARANLLLDAAGREPSFETVLQIMYNAGFRGDVYPAPRMWDSAPTVVFPRYPFPQSLKQLCEGGY